MDGLPLGQYWIVDILPRRVPPGPSGRYFTVERYFLSHLEAIVGKFHWMLLRLGCYRTLEVSRGGESWMMDPTPEDLGRMLGESCTSPEPLLIRVQPTGAVFSYAGDHYMTLYGADGELLDLVGMLSASEGLFLWGPEGEGKMGGDTQDTDTTNNQNRTEMENKELIERVSLMEAIYDGYARILSELEAVLGRMEDCRDDVGALRTYMESGQWKKDYETDEAGLIPQGVKRGVLSQDGLYDLLRTADEIRSRALKILGE